MNTDQIPFRNFLQTAGIVANAAFLAIGALSATPSDGDLDDDNLNGSNSGGKDATKTRRDRCHKQ